MIGKKNQKACFTVLLNKKKTEKQMSEDGDYSRAIFIIYVEFHCLTF